MHNDPKDRYNDPTHCLASHRGEGLCNLCGERRVLYPATHAQHTPGPIEFGEYTVSAIMPCGCEWWHATNNAAAVPGEHGINYCATHAAAPELLAALIALDAERQSNHGDMVTDAEQRARAAIRTAEGS